MQPCYTLLSFLAFYLLASVHTIAEPKYRLAQTAVQASFIVKHKLILVEGAIDGKTGFFLFDTGANELVLNKRHFSQGSGFPSGHFYSDIHGKGPHGYVFVSRFDWAGLEREKFYTPRIDLSAMERAMGEHILGIIGYDVLRHVEAVVDYYAGSLSLYPNQLEKDELERQPPDFIFSFTLDGHLPVLRGRLGMAKQLRLGIDSGAAVNICEIGLQDKLLGKAMQQRTIGLMGAGGRLKRAPCYVMENLEIENTFRIAYCRVALGDLKKFRDDAFKVDALIGVNFFRLGRVAINYRSKRIRVWVGQNDYTLRMSPLPAAGPPVPAAE